MPMPRPLRSARRARLALAAAVFAAPLLAAPAFVAAQDATPNATPNAVATPSAAISPPITAVGVGEAPSTGTLRPGPVGLGQTPRPLRQGDPPVAIQIDPIGVAADIERRQVVDGAMQDPTGPWIVSWYDNLGTPGQGNNVVMAGHIDYWNVGPAVFYHLADLKPGDAIRVVGQDGNVFTYDVQWVKQFDAADAPLTQIVGDAGQDTLTLITCGGTFDYTNGHYLQRTVVRADRVPTVAAAPSATGG
ncbi:MAG TPA: class F sortase [Thermomicrobiales bacterium]|nr:class F sortase [Thermomicrobiales bacterium]